MPFGMTRNKTSAATLAPMVLSPDEVAAALRVTRQYVYELMARGELDSVTIGRHRRISVQSVERLVANGCAPGLSTAIKRAAKN